MDIVISTMGSAKTKQFSWFFEFTENNTIEFTNRGKSVDGINREDIEYSRILDFETSKLLIEAGKDAKIKKFVLVTAMLMTRPETFHAYALNTLVGLTLKHKLKAENLLR